MLDDFRTNRTPICTILSIYHSLMPYQRNVFFYFQAASVEWTRRRVSPKPARFVRSLSKHERNWMNIVATCQRISVQCQNGRNPSIMIQLSQKGTCALARKPMPFLNGVLCCHCSIPYCSWRFDWLFQCVGKRTHQHLNMPVLPVQSGTKQKNALMMINATRHKT